MGYQFDSLYNPLPHEILWKNHFHPFDSGRSLSKTLATMATS